MSDREWLWCADCEAMNCDCGGGFYEITYDDDTEMDEECPCCGSSEVQP